MSVTTDSTRDWSNWTATQLADYLKTKGLDDYAEVFVSNNITGQVAPSLTDENLKEMGISVVGDRLRIIQALQQLKASQAQQDREKVVWQGEEVLYVSWFHQCCSTCGGCCPQDASTYTLRSNHLEIKTVHPCRLGPITCCCGERYDIDNIDLSEVTDTDVEGVPPGCLQQVCCCGDTLEHVKIQTSSEGEKVLILHKDVGQDVARRLKNQVETMQQMERS